jgi:16S rRNA processing protein RimM
MKYICIGKYINTHGIRGEIKIESYSDFDAERYKKGKTVYMLIEGAYQPFTVASFRKHKGHCLVSFEGKDNINDVEPYKGSMIFVKDEDRKPLGKGEFYRSDLIGLDVFDESHTHIGKILQVEETLGANLNLRILKEDGKEVLVPYVPDFIRNVDPERQEMTIHTMEGLL